MQAPTKGDLGFPTGEAVERSETDGGCEAEFPVPPPHPSRLCRATKRPPFVAGGDISPAGGITPRRGQGAPADTLLQHEKIFFFFV